MDHWHTAVGDSYLVDVLWAPNRDKLSWGLLSAAMTNMHRLQGDFACVVIALCSAITINVLVRGNEQC